MDICHFKNAELERKSTSTDDELYSVVTVWKTVLALSRCISGAGFGRKSNGCCSKATRMRRTGSRFSIIIGIIDISKVRMSRKLDTSNTIGQNQCPAWKTQSFILNEICTDIHLLASSEKSVRRNSFGTWMGEGTELTKPIGATTARFVQNRERGRQKMAGRKQNVNFMLKKMMKFVDLGKIVS